MISNIHKAVIKEIKDHRPIDGILSDLIVSFAGLILNEVRDNTDIIDKKKVITFASSQLEAVFKVIQSY